MEILIVGTRGAPKATLSALKQALEGANPARLIVTLVTDWQDQRKHARYAVFIRGLPQPILSLDAFGPAFGPQGDQALHELVVDLLQRGVQHWYEAVLPPSEFAYLFTRDPEEIYPLLVAAANPSDPNLYILEGFASRL